MKFIITLILFCSLGCAWVCKENWHTRLSRNYLALQIELREVEARQMNLSCELSEVSKVTDIEINAMRRLGMVSTTESPDTIWCADKSVPSMASSLSLYNL